MGAVQFYKEEIEVQNNDLSFLKVGDIIWAKRYKNNYERSRLERGHQESPFVVIKIENGKVYCLQCTSNPHQEVKWNILYYPLGRLNYETRKNSYIKCLTVSELKEIQFVELIGHLSDYDLNQLKKQLYILKNSKFKIKPKIERKYLDFKIWVGDIIEYNNRRYYIDSLNDKEFEVYQVSKKIKKDRSILINNTYYNFLFQNKEKINIHSFYNLVDTFNTGEIELINKYKENFHINGDSKEDLKIGSLIEYKENLYYVYDEKNNDQLVYHVYNHYEKGMADILIDGYIYHTYFEQEIILKEKLIKYGYNIKAYASSPEIEYNQKVFNLPKSKRILERKKLANDLLSSKRGVDDFIPMVILKNTNNQNYYLIVGREDNIVELVNINDFMDIFYFELDDNSPFEYYRILQKEEYDK